MAKVLIVTGLIGAGKSTVVKLFAEKGIPTLDADTLAHVLYKDVNHPICQQIVAKFGQQIIINNEIDRKALRASLHSKADWQWLEQLVEPVINKAIENFVKSNEHQPLVVIEISVMNKLSISHYDTLLVETSLENQLSRVKKRSNLSEEEIMFRINKQKTLLEGISFTHTITNNALAITKTIVQQIVAYYNGKTFI